MNDLEDRLRDAYKNAARTVSPGTMRLTAPPSPPARRRSRWMTVYAPLAAAAAVIVAIGIGVAVSRLTGVRTGSASQPTTGPTATTRTPPFMVVTTANDTKPGSLLRVEAAPSGRVLGTLRPPVAGTFWAQSAATGSPTTFIVTAQQTTGNCGPSYLYTLTLWPDGSLHRLASLTVPRLTGDLVGVAASSDGTTVGYALDTCGNQDAEAVVGIVTPAGFNRQWDLPAEDWPRDVTMSADGNMLAFVADSLASNTDAVWVLRTSAPPGSVSTVGRILYNQRHVMTKGTRETFLESAAISAGGGALYVATASGSKVTPVVSSTPAVHPSSIPTGALASPPPAGQSSPQVNSLIRYDIATGTSPGTVLTWQSTFFYPWQLMPVGGQLLTWVPDSVFPAYLLDPGAGTKAVIPLHGIAFQGGNTWLAW